MYRVIQWATGGVGRAAIQGVLRHPELELVGCWVHSADKEGRDAGELAGEAPAGVAATTDIDALLATDADCVMYSPLLPDDAVVAAILRSGKNVVTPVGWVYPDRDNPAVAALEAAAREGGVTLHGSGIHPGGITERFPLMVSSLSSAITHVRAEEFSDLRTYNAPMVVREVMGFGLTPEQAMSGPMAVLLEAGFKQSVRMVVDELGFAAEPRIRSTQEVAVAVTSAHGRGSSRSASAALRRASSQPWPKRTSGSRWAPSAHSFQALMNLCRWPRLFQPSATSAGSASGIFRRISKACR